MTACEVPRFQCALSVILAHFAEETSALIRPLTSKKATRPKRAAGLLPNASAVPLQPFECAAQTTFKRCWVGSNLAKRLIGIETTGQYTPLPLQFHSKRAGVRPQALVLDRGVQRCGNNRQQTRKREHAAIHQADALPVDASDPLAARSVGCGHLLSPP
jgi:hypothetical protein